MSKCPQCESVSTEDIELCPIDGMALIAPSKDSHEVVSASHVETSTRFEKYSDADGSGMNSRAIPGLVRCRRMRSLVGAVALAVLLTVGCGMSESKADETPKVGDKITNDIGMEFSWIPAGNFMMGSTDEQVEEAWRECREFVSECPRSSFEREQPQRQVTIPRGFWMGRHEVTQGQYEAVMGTNPSTFDECGTDCSVERVSWDDAKEFIKRLNDRNDGFVYSLPSEAEWEYAARAGTTTAFAFGDSLSSRQANFNGNYPFGNAEKGPYLEKTTKVGSYDANAWGLHDMHGNVWEWVEDILHDDYTGLPTDGSANTTIGDSSQRILRGGSWGGVGMNSRSAYRDWIDSPVRGNDLGFRVVARAKSQ